MLEGIKVKKTFGGLIVLNDVDFLVEDEKIVGLIGPNGSGKTTLFNCISGIYTYSGEIKYNGKSLRGLKAHEICRLGIARTFQIPRAFLKMSVLENVLVGVLFRRGKPKNKKEAVQEALQWLEFVGLADKKDAPAKSLTLRERKNLSLALALSTQPKLLLLDEVLSGLSLQEVMKFTNMIRDLRDKLGITLFWVEHVMKGLMSVVDYVYVLHHGEKIAEGKPNEIIKNENVINAYLGEKI